MKMPLPSWRHTASHAAADAWKSDTAQGSFERLWRVFMNARIAIAVVLVAMQQALHALGTTLNPWTLAGCIAYFCATLAVRFWAHPRPPSSSFDSLWLLTIGVDVMAFSLLNFFQSSPLNYTPLFALPVLLASVLGPILLAFGTAASVALLLLADVFWSSVHGREEVNAQLLQAALSGSGFFLMALLANQLALRLVREEKLTQESQAAARLQIQVNELVVATLVEGVLVMDAVGFVRSANPTARRFLAAQENSYPVPFKLASQPAWQPLAALMQRTFTQQSAQESHISLVHPRLNAKRLQARSRLVDSRDGAHESLCVIFLDDLREIEARVRIEKLAAMGRMSAAVAHEIRNPLAAISQANALLEEELRDPAQRQLTGMIGQNARRLAKIVDEVLNISRAQQQIPPPQATMLQLDEAVQQIANEWARQNAVVRQLGIHVDTGNTQVCFDNDHLRRLMLNLLDNALRYATDTPQAVEVSTQLLEPGQARLAVWSDGQPLEETVEIHLFEPFFSSESRSSGLGLYICRELCERYGAQIGYQRVLRRDIPGNEFFVMFQPASQRIVTDLSSVDTILV